MLTDDVWHKNVPLPLHSLNPQFTNGGYGVFKILNNWGGGGGGGGGAWKKLQHKSVRHNEGLVGGGGGRPKTGRVVHI